MDVRLPTMESLNPKLAIPAKKRNQNACDACRQRKIKCLYDGPICRACIELEVACTRLRPRKKRGPMNSYAAAEKRKESFSSSSSPNFLPNPADCLSQLGSWSSIQEIINDWFEVIHSVAPLLYRHEFLTRIANGDAQNNPEFCGLVISICAATVASLKRKSSSSYGGITVQGCMEIIKHNQLLKNNGKFTLDWCQANYNLGSAILAGKGMDDVDGYYCMSQSVIGVKYLIYYELPNMPFIHQQLLKRLYWLLFAGLCTVSMLGRPYISLLTFQDDIQMLRPADMTDNELDAQVLDEPWHGASTSYVAGLNFLSDLFLIWYESQERQNRTQERIQENILRVQRALDSVPPPLRWRGGLSSPLGSNFGTDVQIANLCITQLHIRSNLVEECYEIAKSQNNFFQDDQIMSQRRTIVQDLLEILNHMPREVFEANGHSLSPKIRDIGAGLIGHLDTEGGNAREDFNTLLERLETIDFVPGLSYN